MSELDHNDYVSITLEFRCNLHCVHCMIEGTMDRLQPQSLETFRRLLDENRRDRRWRGIILTGAEITLLRDLSELAEAARSAGFERVRIQTHGMRLDSRDYTDRLVSAGINEFFVSVAGVGESHHDGITGVPGSFRRMMNGLANLDRYPDVAVITNTVVTERSYRQLSAIVRQLDGVANLRQMEFWHYWPMSEHDDKGLIASHDEILPHLREAIAINRQRGTGVEIKNFPHCLLGGDGRLLLNDQPQLLIDQDFWPEFMRNGFEQCRFRDKCHSQQCLGLNSAYIERFGWEESLLRPLDEEEGRDGRRRD